jgi:DNA repair protein RadC
LAQSIILVHNHPSGNLKPSEQDKRLTERMVKIGRELDLPVLDHVIFTDHGYFSFADDGIL